MEFSVAETLEFVDLKHCRTQKFFGPSLAIELNQTLLITVQRCGVTDLDWLTQVLDYAREQDMPVIDVLLDLHVFDEHAFLLELSQNMMIPWWEPDVDWVWNPRLAWLTSRELAERHGFVPLGGDSPARGERGAIHLATYNPLDAAGASQVGEAYDVDVLLHMTTRSVVLEGRAAIYGEFEEEPEDACVGEEEEAA